MSLPQMRNLRFSLNLLPGSASLTCNPLDVYHLPPEVLTLCWIWKNCRIHVCRGVSGPACSFFTQHAHYDYSNHAQEESAREAGLALQQDETTADIEK